MARIEPEEVGLNNLRPKRGATKATKRLGRGKGTGQGKTAGRGHKGYGSRSGSKRKPGYEGGQNPIHMRMRKLRGPHMKKSMPFEPFRTHTQAVNLSDLEARFDAGAEVTLDAIKGAGLARRSPWFDRVWEDGRPAWTSLPALWRLARRLRQAIAPACLQNETHRGCQVHPVSRRDIQGV